MSSSQVLVVWWEAVATVKSWCDGLLLFSMLMDTSAQWSRSKIGVSRQSWLTGIREQWPNTIKRSGHWL